MKWVTDPSNWNKHVNSHLDRTFFNHERRLIRKKPKQTFNLSSHCEILDGPICFVVRCAITSLCLNIGWYHVLWEKYTKQNIAILLIYRTICHNSCVDKSGVVFLFRFRNRTFYRLKQVQNWLNLCLFACCFIHVCCLWSELGQWLVIRLRIYRLWVWSSLNPLFQFTNVRISGA